MFHLNKKTFYQKSLECWKWQRSKWQEEHKPADGSMEFFFLQLFLHDTWLVWRLPGNVPGSDRQLCNWIVRFFIWKFDLLVWKVKIVQIMLPNYLSKGSLPRAISARVYCIVLSVQYLKLQNSVKRKVSIENANVSAKRQLSRTTFLKLLRVPRGYD